MVRRLERPVYFGVSTVHTQGALRTHHSGRRDYDNPVPRRGAKPEHPANDNRGLCHLPRNRNRQVRLLRANEAGIRNHSLRRPLHRQARLHGHRLGGFPNPLWLTTAGCCFYNGDETEVTLDESLGIRSIVGGAFLSSGAARVNITGTTPMIELYDGAVRRHRAYLGARGCPRCLQGLHLDSLRLDNRLIARSVGCSVITVGYAVFRVANKNLIKYSVSYKNL